jgi:ubiquinone/menaquinone biosynthesis C-methylase UbiE
MSDQLEFDDATARRLEKLYMSRDVRRRRRIATNALAPRAGHHVLDIGCGPGFHVAELADAVGNAGRVTAVDVSDAMLGLAATRNTHRSNAEFLSGDATDLPLPDASLDGAVAVQIYEYVADVGAAVSEAFRVLKPGGRLSIVDIDWSTVSWFSSDPQHMEHMLGIWDKHLAHPSLPQRLAGLLADAGFTDIRPEGHVFVNTNAGPDSYSGSLIPLITDFATRHGVVSQDAATWADDLERLDATGRYFFAVTKFSFSADRPH